MPSQAFSQPKIYQGIQRHYQSLDRRYHWRATVPVQLHAPVHKPNRTQTRTTATVRIIIKQQQQKTPKQFDDPIVSALLRLGDAFWKYLGDKWHSELSNGTMFDSEIPIFQKVVPFSAKIEWDRRSMYHYHRVVWCQEHKTCGAVHEIRTSIAFHTRTPHQHNHGNTSYINVMVPQGNQPYTPPTPTPHIQRTNKHKTPKNVVKYAIQPILRTDSTVEHLVLHEDEKNFIPSRAQPPAPAPAWCSPWGYR